jgi:hypothetical protein
MYIIYPNPGSYNDFRERNPNIEPTLRMDHISDEISMWRATSPDIDMRVATLNTGEASIRAEIADAVSRGETVLRLAEWPKVGDYEVPAILDRSSSQ